MLLDQEAATEGERTDHDKTCDKNEERNLFFVHVTAIIACTKTLSKHVILVDMLKRQEHEGVVWIDLESPTHDEIARVAHEYALEPMLAEELANPSSKPGIQVRGDYLHLVLHFPALRHSHRSRIQEVDCIVGRKVIITAHYDTVDAIHKFSKLFEVNAVLDKTEVGDHAGFVLFHLLRKLYRSVEHELEYIRRELQIIEEHIFQHHESQMVISISHTARDLLTIRQTIEPHRDMLQELEEASSLFFGDDFKNVMKRLSQEYFRVHNHASRSLEHLRELRDTNDSLLATKQNDIMRTLTIMSLFTFPLALLVAILAVDAVGNPVIHMHNGFWVIVGLAAIGWLSMFVFFKRKKWL